MTPEDFDLYAALVKQRSGLVLTPEKAYLLESRLLPVARKYQLPSLKDMAHIVRIRREETMLSDITEAMTTNESFFFRDQKPFLQFQKMLLPELLVSRAAKKHIRIWSAAASSGQEAYSLAMICAEEAARLQGWKIDILGTDISKDMIDRARNGIYTQFEAQRGLPAAMLVKYFQQVNGDKWQVRDNIRQMAQFRDANLLHDFGPIGVFDIVYCRNVLIYFDPPIKKRVLEAIANVMTPDGKLFLGGAETVLGISDKFQPADATQGLYVLAASRKPATAKQAAG